MVPFWNHFIDNFPSIITIFFVLEYRKMMTCDHNKIARKSMCENPCWIIQLVSSIHSDDNDLKVFDHYSLPLTEMNIFHKIFLSCRLGFCTKFPSQSKMNVYHNIYHTQEECFRMENDLWLHDKFNHIYIYLYVLCEIIISNSWSAALFQYSMKNTWIISELN